MQLKQQNKDNTMAFWTDTNNSVFLYRDDCLNFPQWIADSEQRTQDWNNAIVEHQAWKAANPTLNGWDIPDDLQAGQIFRDWMEYANAMTVTLPPNTP